MPAKTVAVERAEPVDGNPNLDVFQGFWLNLRGKAIAHVEKLWAEGKLRCRICSAKLTTEYRPFCIGQAILKDKTLYLIFGCKTCGETFSKGITEAKNNAEKKKATPATP